MKYEKVLGKITKAWLNGDESLIVGHLPDKNDSDRIAVIVNNGAAMYIIPWALNPFDYERITSGEIRDASNSMMSIVDRVVKGEREVGSVTGVTRKQNGRTLMQIEGEAVTVWVDTKLTEYFGRGAEYHLGESWKSVVAVYEEGRLVGLVCPVKPDWEKA